MWKASRAANLRMGSLPRPLSVCLEAPSRIAPPIAPFCTPWPPTLGRGQRVGGHGCHFGRLFQTSWGSVSFFFLVGRMCAGFACSGFSLSQPTWRGWLYRTLHFSCDGKYKKYGLKPQNSKDTYLAIQVAVRHARCVFITQEGICQA